MAVSNTLLLENESWRIGMNETVPESIHNAAVLFHTKKLYCTRKSRNLQRNCLFSFSFKSFELLESDVLLIHIFYIPALPAGH